MDKTESCWNWIASIHKTGYGQFKFDGKMVPTHRMSWKLTYGDIPKGEEYHGVCVLHTCDNRRCVNPDHLFLGSHVDNMKDKNMKNRQARVHGEESGMAKLTVAQVISIRFIYSRNSISQKKLAKEFDISQTQINNIVNGKQWSHISKKGDDT